MSGAKGVALLSGLSSWSGLAGFVMALPIFNQIDLGANVSLLWPIVVLSPLVYGARTLPVAILPLLALLVLALFKFTLAVNPEAILRYATYIAFVVAAVTALDQDRLDRMFAGFEAGLLCNGIFGLVQMAGLLSGAYDAVLPVQNWNGALWHANPEGGMFTGFPRVSGFANEPAYLGILICSAAAYRLFIRRAPTLTGLYGIAFWFGILVLVNSRTAFVAALWIAACRILMVLRGSAGFRSLCLIVFLASFVALPATILVRAGTAPDYDWLLRDDISVFSRAAPLAWIMDGNNLTLRDYVVGVPNYRSFAPAVNMPPLPYAAMISQGVLLDAKSLGGAYFFDLGLLGTALFAAATFLACRGEPLRLLFFSTVNVAFFNVYAFSWPLFWLMTVALVIAPEAKPDTAPAGPSTRRSRQRNADMRRARFDTGASRCIVETKRRDDAVSGKESGGDGYGGSGPGGSACCRSG